jgi:MFS transporter, ACS family, tartrate transporter
LHSSFDSDIERAVISKLTWRLVPFLFLLYIVGYLDRTNVGFAALQMQRQLHFNDAVYGLGAGMFFAGYFCFQLPSNLVLARIGAPRWIALLMVLWGIVSASTVFVTTPRSFYLLRFLLGAAEAGFFPGIIFYFKNWFPASVRARTIAWFMTAGPLSGAIGGPISGALLGFPQTGRLAGWQWLFLMEGLPAILLGIVVFFYLTASVETAPWLSPEQRKWLMDTLRSERQLLAAAGGANAFAAFRSGKVWLLAFVYFGLNTCVYGISLWLPTLIRNLSGMSSFAIGLISAIPYLAAATAMVLVGHHSDHSGERRWHIAIAAFVGAAALGLTAYSQSAVPLIVATSFAIAGASAMDGPFWAMSTSLLSGTAAAAGIALINSVGNLGGFFGPYIIGLVRTSTGGFKGGLLVSGATLAASGCLALLVRSRRVTA